MTALSAYIVTTGTQFPEITTREVAPILNLYIPTSQRGQRPENLPYPTGWLVGAYTKGETAGEPASVRRKKRMES